jgi:hypothetical protein
LDIENLSRRREDLTYGRADPTISNVELEEAQKLVDRVLTRLFHIQLDA